MNRSLLPMALLFALVVGQSPAAAELRTYEFAPAIEPAFRYVSGDLPCDVTAHLVGQVIVSVDDVSGVAQLLFSEVTLHSTQTELFGVPHTYPEGHYCNVFRDSLEGSMLSMVMPGVDVAIQGFRVSPTELKFGPSLTDDQAFMREFTLHASAQSLQLFGSSVFYGDDGPSYVIDASLMLVPEPVAVDLLLAAAIAAMRPMYCRSFRWKSALR